MKNETQTNETQSPVARFNIGLIQAAIWADATEGGTEYGVTIERRYRNVQGQWRTARRLRFKDLQPYQELLGRVRAELLKLSPTEA